MNSSQPDHPRPLTFALLRALSDGHFQSGEVLARQHGVSRATVHNALSEAVAMGVELFRVTGRGYRLVEPPQWLDEEKIRASGGAQLQRYRIELLDSASSSNTLLLQRAAQGAASGTVLAVEWQSAGRGRLGRVWHSGLGNALTFSVLWRFDCGLSGLAGLSLAVGVAVLRALRTLGVQGAGLKWPNDLLASQGKLAGILIEAQGEMLGPSAVVIGIGLNLRLPVNLPQEIGQPVAAVDQLCPAPPERNRILAVLLQELAQTLDRFAQHGFAALRAEWEAAHVWQDQRVVLALPDGRQVSGVARGVNDTGALRLETVQGMEVFNSGEISVRAWA